MEHNQDNSAKDPHLWEIAKRRAAFKTGFITYVIVNAFLWAIWYFTGGRSYDGNGLPWPVWPTLGWGLGIVFQYFGAYVYPGANSAEREYDKLKNKQQ